MKTTLFVIIALLLVPVMVSPGFGQETSGKAIRVNGAGMASDQVQKWAIDFMKANPGINVVVIGSSAGKGFKALIERDTDLALASRNIRPEEEKQAEQKGLKLEKKVIGHSGVAIVTSAQNPINELTVDQIRKIFCGEYSNWKEVGGPDLTIRCLTRRVPESGGAVFFQNTVLKGQPYGPATKITETWGTITKVCSSANDLPIGIAPWTRIEVPGLKVLAVKEDEASPAMKPNIDTLKEKGYPIVLPFSFYWNGLSLDSDLKKFVDYCATRGAANSGSM